MKKKTLLFTTIAGAAIVAGMSLSGVKAASEKAIVRTCNGYPVQNLNSVVVELRDNQKSLAKEDFIELLESKFVRTTDNTAMNVKVQSISKNGSEIADGSNVGTGATVKLSTGKEITVVLYGDVDGNGSINILDADRIAASVKGSKSLTDVEKAAANIVSNEGSSSSLNVLDADRIAAYLKDGFSKDNYVDFVPSSDSMPQPMDLSVTTGTTYPNVYTEISDDGRDVLIKAEFSKGNIGATRTGYAGKWFEIKLNPNISNWSVKETGDNIKINSTENTVSVWVKAENDASSTVTLVNNSDTTETMEVALKVVDVKMPTATAVKSLDTAVTFGTSNNISNKTVAVEMNANLINEYKLQFTTDMAYSDIKVVAISQDAEGKDILTTLTTEPGETDKDVIVTLDAKSPTTKLVFANKNAAKDQITDSSNVVNLTVTNKGEIKISKVSKQKLANVDNASNNSAIAKNAEEIQTTKSEYAVTVKGDLTKMVPCIVETKTVNGKKVVNVLGENDEGYVAENAKKYYVLAIDTDYSIDKIYGDNIIKDKDIIEKFIKADNEDTTSGKTILLLLNAEEPTTTFTLTNAYNPDNDEKQESFTFTVNFEDVSAPTLKSVDKYGTENAIKVTGHTIDSVTVGAVKSAMTETERIIEQKNNEIRKETGLWYQLVIDTGIDNKLINVKRTTTTGVVDKYTFEQIDNTKIAIWVNGSLASDQFDITNKNDSDKKISLTVTTNEVKTVSVHHVYGNIYENNAVSKLGSKKEQIKDAIGSGATDSDVEKAINNIMAVAKYTGEDAEGNHKLEVNLNKLEKFTVHGKEGKWLPLTVNISGNIPAEKAFDNGYFIPLNGDCFADGPVEQSKYTRTLLWVDANALLREEYTETNYKTEDTLAFNFEVPNEIYGVNEKITLRLIIVKDTSTFKDTGKKDVVDQGYEVTVDNIKEHSAKTHFTDWETKPENVTQYYVNQKLISDISSKREGNVVTVNVKGDFVRMGQLTNNVGGTGKLVTLKLDLGIKVSDNTNLVWRYSKAINGSEITWDNDSFSTVSQNGRDYYGCAETEDYLNDVVKWDGGKTEGIIFTRILEYKDKTNTNGDVLRFVINYEQVSVTDEQYAQIKSDVEALEAAAKQE